MKLLLDTHVFLWLIAGDARLPAPRLQQICDPANEVYLSVASVWECIVKSQLGKLPLPAPPETYLPAARTRHHIASLDIDEPAVVALAQLAPVTRDPFDRILLAQSACHGLRLLTADKALQAYGHAAIDSL